ncbi:MAG: DUF5777 family beta-barrel protein [Bacteroidota bacterium]|nr:DUF5777 family beta-barrel protein [Bacteroidota bacterium]
MKSSINKIKSLLGFVSCLIVCLFILNSTVQAQADSAAEEASAPVKLKPVKNTFQSIWILNNQTIMVPQKNSLEVDIQHRFGTVNNGYQDFWGFFAPSNIRLGVNYSFIKGLNLGVGITKSNMLVDGNAKYAIITQTKGKYPVSVSYYANMAWDSRKDPDHGIFKYGSQRFSFFNQLLVARKITDKLSLQVSGSVSHQNSVNGYYTKNDSTGKTIFKEMKFDHFAFSFSGRYKITDVTAIMIDYDQPITKHATNNPNPNLSFGVEFNTGGHAFQFFLGNYSYMSPQRDNMFNTNSPFGYTDKATGKKVKGGQFLIGFNITRLWNY